jgi:general secretion pathway protein A
MEQLAQRVVVDYHLEALTREEIDTYVAHRLRVAGSKDPYLFEGAALDRIYRHTRGVPRLINILCESALVYGYAAQEARISAALMEELIRDRRQGGVLPLDPEEQTSVP